MEIRPTITLQHLKTGEKGNYRIDQAKILIGRDKTCFIFLKDRTVSRRHAEIVREGPSFFLKDLQSGNRTFLNDLPLPPHEKTLLRSGDRIRVGDFELRFLTPGPKGDIYEVTDSDILEIKMVKKLMKALDRDSAPSLEVIEGPEAGKRFSLEGKSQEILIGRDPACEFRVDSDVISRKHARVTRKFDTVEIEDLGSRNGIYVAKERIKKKILKDGDRIHLGTVVVMFRNPQQAMEEISRKVETERPVRAAPQEAPTAPPEPPTEGPEALPEGPSASAPPRWQFSTTEILMALLGLVVLVGALWGILKIL